MWDICGFLKDTRRGLLKNESFGGWWPLKIVFLLNYSLFSTRGHTEHRFLLLYQNFLFPGGWKTSLQISSSNLPNSGSLKYLCSPQRLLSSKRAQDADGRWNSSEERGAVRLLFSGRVCLRSQGFVEAEGSSGETSPLDFSLDFSEKTKSGAEVGDAGGGGKDVKWVRSLHFDRTACPLECLSWRLIMSGYYLNSEVLVTSWLELASNCLWKNLDSALKCHCGLLFSKKRFGFLMLKQYTFDIQNWKIRGKKKASIKSFV